MGLFCSSSLQEAHHKSPCYFAILQMTSRENKLLDDAELLRQDKQLLQMLSNSETPVLSSLSARCSHGTVRKEHGVEIAIVGKPAALIRPTYGNVFRGSLDVHGDGMVASCCCLHAMTGETKQPGFIIPFWFPCTFQVYSRRWVPRALWPNCFCH